MGQAIRVRSTLAALGLVALAFFLRVYRLADKNIWWDEGWTIWMAQHDWIWIALRTASDEHPPLHYWLMNLWQDIFGPAAMTGRFFSVAFGVLGVAVLYRIGKAVGGARLGLLVVLFLTLARFQVWWSQDIKNYTLSAFFAWASVWFTWQIVNREWQTADSKWQTGKRDALYVMGYVLTAALALFSHYLAALIVLANNGFVVFVLLAQWHAGKNPMPLFWKWAAAQIAVVVLLSPWLYLYWQNGATWTAAPAFDFGLFLRLAATVLTLGVTTYIENYTWVVLGMLVVAVLSVGWFIRPQTADNRRQTTDGKQPTTRPLTFAWGTLYMLLIVLLPPALIYILSLTPAAIFAPKIQARYLMMLAPAFALLLALGVLYLARSSKYAAAAVAMLVVGAQLFTLTDYFRERILYDEYTTLAQMINNFGARDDVIVLDTDQEYPTFLYYLKRPFAWVGVPNGAPVNDATAQHVAADALQHRGVWVVTIPDALQKDPQRLVEQKIAARLPKQYEQTFGDKRLALYADPIRNVKDVAPENFSPLAARDEILDERLKLVGVDLPVREVLPGDVVRVITYWQVQDLTTLNVALQTPDGRTVAQASIPLSMGAHERAQADLQIPPDVNVNELRVVAHARLGALAIGTLAILPRANVPVSRSAAMQPRSERFGDSIRLIGVARPQPTARRGETLSVILFWQTNAPVATSYTVFVHLLGAQYNPAQNNFLWGQVDRIPVEGKLPTNAWTPQQMIADAYQVQVDANAPNGMYNIEIGMYDANGTRLRVFDANGNEMGDALIVGQVRIGN
jgi:mannosyltransferase